MVFGDSFLCGGAAKTNTNELGARIQALEESIFVTLTARVAPYPSGIVVKNGNNSLPVFFVFCTQVARRSRWGAGAVCNWLHVDLVTSVPSALA